MLQIEALDVFYGQIHALKGVGLEVQRGEIVAILGNNGAGKTTTLKTISGLLVPRRGRIALEGQALSGVPPHEIVLRGIGYVPEGRRIFNRLTVRENLMMGAYLRKDDGVPADLERVFTLFPVLRERLGQVAGTLSGGEQQMLAIGRALMANPRLLLLDEPSFGLAPLVVQEIFRIMELIRRERRVGILLVEQNASLALEVADQAYLLETGRVVLGGPAAQVKQDEAVRKSYLGY